MAEPFAPIESMLQMMQNTWPNMAIEATVTIKRLFYAREVLFGRVKHIIENYGLSSGEYDALFSLRIQPPPYELTPTDICQVNMLSSGGLTKVLNNLETRELVNRRTCPADQRSRRVQITAKGIQLIDEILMQVFEDNAQRLQQALTEEEQREFDRLLKRINQIPEK